MRSSLALALLVGLTCNTAALAREQRLAPVQTAPFPPDATRTTCFTPGQDCTGTIVSQIDKARSSIVVQAYSFTSAPIAEALVRAKKRGVAVRAVLDKSQKTERYSGATFLANAGIPVLIDEKVAIAHNKVILIDETSTNPIVITGSFNFSKAAQERNAENVLIIAGDRDIARLYGNNIREREAVSVPYQR